MTVSNEPPEVMSETVPVRLQPATIDALDAIVAKRRVSHPHAPWSRSAVLREAIAAGLQQLR